MSAGCTSVYVSENAAEDDVLRAVNTWMATTGRALTVNVEFGDEYPGFLTAIDVYADDDAAALTEARALAEGIAELVPNARVSVDIDIEASGPARNAT